MTPTPAVSTVDHPRVVHLVLAAAIVLGFGATSCDTKAAPTTKVVAATPTPSSAPHGYSYDHDSRINETP